MKLHIIFTTTDMILSKKQYESWREIQDEYEVYKASLGPWEHDEVVDYLNEEYPDLNPKAKTQVDNLLQSDNETNALSF